MTSTRRNFGVEQHTRLPMTTYCLRIAGESNEMMSLSVEFKSDCVDEAQRHARATRLGATRSRDFSDTSFRDLGLQL